jgi:hypothetical protein
VWWKIVIIFVALGLIGSVLPDPTSEDASTADSTVVETSTTIAQENWAENLKPEFSTISLQLFLCDGLKKALEDRAILVWSRLVESEVPAEDPFKSAAFVRETSWANVNHVETSKNLLRTVTDPILTSASKDLPDDSQYSDFLSETILACELQPLSEDLKDSSQFLDDRLAGMIWDSNNLPWYPSGFRETFPGIAFKVADRKLSCYSCRGIVYEVISAISCPNQLYVEANFIDGNGTLLDWSNDVVPSLQAGQVAYVELITYSAGIGSVSAQLTQADCF